MAKYLTAILLYAVTFYSSVFAKSLHAHHEKPQHGNSVENNANIEEFIQLGFDAAEGLYENPQDVAAYRNILHEAKHKHWNSFEKFAEYVESAVKKIMKKTNDDVSRIKRSFDLDSDDEDLKKLSADKFLKSISLSILLRIAPPAYKSALFAKFKEIYNTEYENYIDFLLETEYVFKKVLGDNIDKYASQVQTDIFNLFENTDNDLEAVE